MSAPLIGQQWAARLLALKPNWDSYGAPRTSREAISTIEHFATVPCSDGGIQLEIHRDGFDIEIVVGPDGTIESALVARENIRPADPTCPLPCTCERGSAEAGQSPAEPKTRTSN